MNDLKCADGFCSKLYVRYTRIIRKPFGLTYAFKRFTITRILTHKIIFDVLQAFVYRRPITFTYNENAKRNECDNPNLCQIYHHDFYAILMEWHSRRT